jgi:hypothetical protein
MKTVRTITIGYDSYLVPDSMNDKDLITFIGTLATLKKVLALHDKGWRESFHYVADSSQIGTKSVKIHDSQSEAQAALDAYNAENASTVLA